MDRRIARLLQQYFSNAVLIPIELTKPSEVVALTSVKQKTKRAKWQQRSDEIEAIQQERALTGAERANLCRLRKNLGVTIRTPC